MTEMTSSSTATEQGDGITTPVKTDVFKFVHGLINYMQNHAHIRYQNGSGLSR